MAFGLSDGEYQGRVDAGQGGSVLIAATLSRPDDDGERIETWLRVISSAKAGTNPGTNLSAIESNLEQEKPLK
jgi:hypothetical protein